MRPRFDSLAVVMLIVPGATDHLLTDQLSLMLVIAAAHGVVSAVVGTILDIYFNTSVAGMMAVVAGGQFTVALIAAPWYGLLSRWLHRALISLRIVREDVLALLFRWHEWYGDKGLSSVQPARPVAREMSPACTMHARAAMIGRLCGLGTDDDRQ